MLCKRWILNGLLAVSLTSSSYADNLDSIVATKVVNGNTYQQVNLLQHHDSHVFVFSIGIPEKDDLLPIRHKYVVDIDPTEDNSDSVIIDGLPYEKRYLFRVSTNVYLLTRAQYKSACKFVKDKRKSVTHKLVQQKLSISPDFILDAPEHDFKPQQVIALEHNGELFDQYHTPVLPTLKTIALLQLDFHPEETFKVEPPPPPKKDNSPKSTKKSGWIRPGVWAESGTIERGSDPKLDRHMDMLKALSDLTGRNAYSVNGRVRLR